MRLWPRSIRWQIFIYYTALIAVGISLLAVAREVLTLKDLEIARGLEMQSRLIELLPFLFPPRIPGPDGQSRPPSPEAMEARLQSPGFLDLVSQCEEEGVFILAVHASGETRFASRRVPLDLELLEATDSHGRLKSSVAGQYLLAIATSPQGDRTVVGVPLKEVYKKAVEEVLSIILLGLVLLAVLSAPGWWLIGRALEPIKTISSSARRIAEGNLDERIDVRAQWAELGELAEVLNQSFSRLEDALKRQVRFTADASHELRTPVAAILADCQFALKRERSTERYLETIKVCEDAARHMKELLERLSVLAHYDAHERPLDLEALDLEEVAGEVAQVIRPLARERGLQFDEDIQSARVHADRLRTAQAAINLLNNAIRYNRPGGRIWLRTGMQNGHAFLEVEDTGVGIPDDKQHRVFERFFRVDDSRNERTGGSGLGLAITHAIVEAHGGKLTLKSGPGRGTLVRIELPAGDSRQPSP